MTRTTKTATIGAALIAAGLLAGCAYGPAPGPYSYAPAYGPDYSYNYGYDPAYYSYGYDYGYGYPGYYGYGVGVDARFGDRRFDRDHRGDRDHTGAGWNHNTAVRPAGVARTGKPTQLRQGPAGHSVAHAPEGNERRDDSFRH